ncbi:MAG: hypothetical protein LBL26_01415 [Peptococcaceae bacterium]|nr:hypothetical protein [Peptococcaceae bacterium]
MQESCVPICPPEYVPVIMDVVFGTGRVCSGSAHYLSESEDGAPIPADACPINCVINDFLIRGQGSEGTPPQKDGGSVRFTVGYQVRVWYEYCSDTRGRDVKAASKIFEQELTVPLCPTGSQQLVLSEDGHTLIVKKIALNAVRAELVPKPEDYPADFPPYAIMVSLEKDFFAMAIGRAAVCVSSSGFYQENFPVFPGDCGGCADAETDSCTQ